MKKTLCFILSLILLLGCASCTGKDNLVKDTDNKSSDTVQTTGENTTGKGEVLTDGDTDVNITEPATGAVTDLPVQDEEGLSVYTESFVSDKCSVTISYPRYADADHELFDISMRNYAMEKYNASGMMPDDNALYEVLSCDIKYESETLVSAVVTGHIINDTAAHDSFFSYTVNADPSTGRIYLPEELVGDLELIKGGIHDNSFTQTMGIAGLLEEINPEDITLSWRSDYGVFPNVYFTNDSFGVVAELPYALGGYASFEISYAGADSMMNDSAKLLVGLLVVN